MSYAESPGDTLTVRCDGMDGPMDCDATLGPFDLERGPTQDSGEPGFIVRTVGEQEAMLSAGWSRQRLPHTEQFRLISGGDHFCPAHWRWRKDGDPVDGRTVEEFRRDWQRAPGGR